MNEWMKSVPEATLEMLHGACVEAADAIDHAMAPVFWVLGEMPQQITDRIRAYRELANELWEERERRHA